MVCLIREYSPESVSTRLRSTEVHPNSILGNFECVDKIVVYAFGAFDRYYICWQDKSGQYQQGNMLLYMVDRGLTLFAERHGLPKVLDEWLFPDDGTTRDLATLQVSLGHHDEFFAFDQHERISHINTELRDNAGSMSHVPQTPNTGVSNRSPDLGGKSHTISHPGACDDSPTMSAKRTAQSRRMRTRSIAITGALSRRSSSEGKKSQEIQPLILESEGGIRSRTSDVRKHSLERRPAYSDAGVQTDIPEHKDLTAVLSLDGFEDSPSAKTLRHPNRSHVSSISSLNSLLSESSSLTMNSTSSFSSTDSASSRNPIYMGAMQRYFRESQYRLGDALIRGPALSIDAH